MIRVPRIQTDIEAIARCTATPGRGATRPTFSPAWAEARRYLTQQIEAVGGHIRIDAAGNLHARPAGLGWDTPAWLVGSHLDSVPHGGDYDGVAGVVLALELLRSADDDGLDTLPVELIDFAEEEGPTFGRGMLGSLGLVGGIDPPRLAELRNADGQSYLDAGRPHGVDPAALPDCRAELDRCLGLIELHAEQGPGLWRSGRRLAVVSAIAGRRQYAVEVRGQANHAGATAMADRRDALAAAAEMVLALEALATTLGQRAVLTVGRLEVEPNAVNVIADRVAFTLDFRDPDAAVLNRGDQIIHHQLSEIADRRGVEVRVRCTEDLPPVPLHPGLAEQLRDLIGDDAPDAVSGALHDAAVIAPHRPTVMLFIPSRDGISHNPAEFSRVEDLAAAAEVVQRFVRRPTVAQLNAADRDAFIRALGHCYEHSPWIAERAWDRRPFTGLDDLADALRQVVNDADVETQLQLIRAHPDLVGRLAAASMLTDASTREQRAAGLDDVTADEAERFCDYNRRYRDKFGFPFVICARRHRKAAILEAMPRRLQNDAETERAAALEQIHQIARLRLRDAVAHADPAALQLS
jgi:allantoate deiminase